MEDRGGADARSSVVVPPGPGPLTLRSGLDTHGFSVDFARRGFPPTEAQRHCWGAVRWVCLLPAGFRPRRSFLLCSALCAAAHHDYARGWFSCKDSLSSAADCLGGKARIGIEPDVENQYTCEITQIPPAVPNPAPASTFHRCKTLYAWRTGGGA